MLFFFRVKMLTFVWRKILEEQPVQEVAVEVAVVVEVVGDPEVAASHHLDDHGLHQVTLQWDDPDLLTEQLASDHILKKTKFVPCGQPYHM